MENASRTDYMPVIIALIIGALIGFFIGTMTVNDTEDNVRQDNSNTEPTGNISGEVESTLVEGDEDETAFTIQVTSLSAAQQTMLRGAGVDGDSIVITKGMVACAEAEMGAGRMVAIQNGAEISMTEGITLIGCYTSN